MKKRKLGETDLECSEIGLGTWALGSGVYGEVEACEADRLIGESLDAGINFFDTAPLYGNKKENGVAEGVLGKGLGSRKEEVIVSTKFGRTAIAVMPPRFSRKEARESCEASLKRIGREWVDLFFFHSPFEPSEIEDEVWEELACLKSEGKIRFIGHSVSMYEDTHELSAQWIQERKIEAIQVVLSPFNRETLPLIAIAEKEGCGVIARECMANGFLSGCIQKNTIFPEGTLNARYSREEIAERVDYAEQLKLDLIHGDVKTLPQASYRWVLDQKGVTLALSGARAQKEIQDAVRSSEIASYSRETLAVVDAIHSRDFCPA